MRVADVMTNDPTCCSADTPVQQAAALMQENDCGCLPVVDSENHVKGVITDRDIACRCVAQGKDSSTPVGEVMTSQARCCGPDDDVTEATRIMGEGQVRRVPVVDEADCCVGMVSQADIARSATDNSEEQQVGDVVKQISQPWRPPSHIEQAQGGHLVR